jgi:hypothetical protein
VFLRSLSVGSEAWHASILLANPTVPQSLPGFQAQRGFSGTRDEMIEALKERGPEAPVIKEMRSDIPIVEHRRNLEEALRVMQEKRLPAVASTMARAA